MNIGEKLRKIRKEKGFIQKGLGKLCGWTDSAIRRYESGSANPKFETVWKVVKTLPELELDVIICKYIEEMETKEISERINNDEREVARIHKNAIRRLRNNRTIREMSQWYNDTIVAECYRHVGVKAYNTTWDSVTERTAIRRL